MRNLCCKETSAFQILYLDASQNLLCLLIQQSYNGNGDILYGLPASQTNDRCKRLNTSVSSASLSDAPSFSMVSAFVAFSQVPASTFEILAHTVRFPIFPIIPWFWSWTSSCSKQSTQSPDTSTSSQRRRIPVLMISTRKQIKQVKIILFNWERVWLLLASEVVPDSQPYYVSYIIWWSPRHEICAATRGKVRWIAFLRVTLPGDPRYPSTTKKKKKKKKKDKCHTLHEKKYSQAPIFGASTCHKQRTLISTWSIW